jgi:hypothetical protein
MILKILLSVLGVDRWQMVTMYEPYIHGDQQSTTMSSNYPQSWTSSSLPASPLSVLPPSESAIELNKMYLQTKTEMVRILSNWT